MTGLDDGPLGWAPLRAPPAFRGPQPPVAVAFSPPLMVFAFPHSHSRKAGRRLGRSTSRQPPRLVVARRRPFLTQTATSPPRGVQASSFLPVLTPATSHERSGTSPVAGVLHVAHLLPHLRSCLVPRKILDPCMQMSMTSFGRYRPRASCNSLWRTSCSKIPQFCH